MKVTAWRRIVIEVFTIVGSILLAFAIDAWWDEFRDRASAEIVLNSLHDELVDVEEFLAWHDQFVDAMQDSAKQLLTAAVGRDRALGEKEVDRLLADLTWFVSETWFAVPELESLVLNDELSLIDNGELRQKLKSWRALNDFFRHGVVLQARFHNERFIPYLEENASLQQISNAVTHTPGFPEELLATEKIELREHRSHSFLLDDPVFQNLLNRRIERMDPLHKTRDERYLPDLRKLIAQIEQELHD